jgi:hypothetical protein
MKKLLPLILSFILFTGTLMSQSIYVRAGGGYGLPIASSVLGEKILYTQVYNGVNTTNSASTESITGSFGSGANFNFALGYKFNENFIFEINTQFLISKKNNSSDNNLSSDPLNLYSYVDNSNTTTSAKGLFFNPSFIFSAGFGKAAPYGRFGLVIGSPKISGTGSYYYNGDGIDSTVTEFEYSKGITFGFQGAIGMNWKLSDKLDIYTEMNFISMTYYPGEYNVTKDVSGNGFTVTDNLPNMSKYLKQTIYEKKFDPSSVNTIDQYGYYNQIIDINKPTVSLRKAMPFSSLSLQIGIRYNLWKKKSE